MTRFRDGGHGTMSALARSPMPAAVQGIAVPLLNNQPHDSVFIEAGGQGRRLRASPILVLLMFSSCLIQLFSYIDLTLVNNEPAVILLITFVYAALRLSFTVASPQPKWARSLYWVFILYIFSLPALYQQVNQDFFWVPFSRFSNEEALYAAVLLLTGIAVTDFILVLGVGARSKIAQQLGSEDKSFPSDPLWLVITVVLCMVIALLHLSVVGLDGLVHLRGAERQIDVEELGATPLTYVLGFLKAIVAGSYFLLVAQMRLRVTKIWTDGSLSILSLVVPIVIVAACYLLLYWPPRMPRFMLGAHLIVLMMLLTSPNAAWRSGAIRTFVFAFPFVLYTAFALFSLVTRGGAEGDLDNALRAYAEQSVLARGDFDNFQVAIWAVRYVAENGVEFGKQIFSALLFFFPRTYWAAKALPTGTLLALEEGVVFLNISTSWYIEWFVDFGFVGLVIGGGILGFLINILDRGLASRIDSLPKIACAIMAAFLLILLRGPLLGVITPIVFTCVGVYALWICRRMTGYLLQWR